jgi:hypothetical protein
MTSAFVSSDHLGPLPLAALTLARPGMTTTVTLVQENARRFLLTFAVTAASKNTKSTALFVSIEASFLPNFGCVKM